MIGSQPTRADTIRQLKVDDMSSLSNPVEGTKRLQRLYPFTELNDLPKAWSTKDKANYISLSENNLKVHYKGGGKGHKDAAAVRATHPIPQSCLMCYFEIKIISKGRDGYMGIGLAAQGVNMQRLPGWDKHSYGYHGDDGHSFCSSGTGQPYGPTFTTGDTIGCAFNLVENTCFYTKNGLNLGTAFNELPSVQLYPTVGLQTPGEEVEANFGMDQFCYDIEQDMIALRHRITSSVIHYPVKYNEWQISLHKLVQTWLIHNGYCGTAEIFSTATKQQFKENVQRIKQRLRIQQLILAGKIGEAIQLTNRLYPEVLNDNPNLLFSLKCRQFIEMISGSESDKVVVQPQSVLTSNGDCNGNSSGDMMDIDIHEDKSERDAEVDDMASKLTRLLAFGKDLHSLSQQLKRQYGSNDLNKKMLQDAFSLLAYSDPWNSPVGWQLNGSERESVCQQLNNAIVMSEMNGSNHRPPLENIVKHTKLLLKLNGHSGAWLIDNL